MPELPEVESIKRALEPKIKGKVIRKVAILSSKNFIGDETSVVGRKITNINRFGKVLVIKLVNPLTRKPVNYLNIHFKLSGQMLYSKKVDNAIFANKIPFTKGKKMPANTTRVIISFSDGSGIFFNDLRKFGWIKVSKKPLSPKGVDVLSKNFTSKLLTDITGKTRKPIKVLLMDQDLITGIGNIYANDSLFLARIHPQRPANSLTANEIKKLHSAIISEIKKGVHDKGSSGADEAFILPDGSKGRHQRRFLVYQREGEKCPRCGHVIKRIKHNGRSSFLCQNCQVSA